MLSTTNNIGLLPFSNMTLHSDLAIPVVVILQYALTGLSITAFSKFIIVSILGVVLTFAFSSLIRQAPFFKKVL